MYSNSPAICYFTFENRTTNEKSGSVCGYSHRLTPFSSPVILWCTHIWPFRVPKNFCLSTGHLLLSPAQKNFNMPISDTYRVSYSNVLPWGFLHCISTEVFLQIVGIELIYPYQTPARHRYRYSLVIQDYSSKWVKLTFCAHQQSR